MIPVDTGLRQPAGSLIVGPDRTAGRKKLPTLHNSSGSDYAYIPGGLPFSSGVVALPGFEIVRARFARPLPVAAGFDAIAAHLREHGRPLTALCAAELRSPEPFSFDGFAEFNASWVGTLRRWGLVRQEGNPVARSNVCPVHEPPAAPVFHAFCYTVPSAAAQAGLLTTSDHSERAPGPRSFVLAGYAEWAEGTAFPDGIVARGDRSSAGLEQKAGFVLDTLQRRCVQLGGDWRALTAVQVYTEHDIGPLVASQFAPRGLLPLGLHWYPCRPPVQGLEFEIDARCVRRELVID